MRPWLLLLAASGVGMAVQAHGAVYERAFAPTAPGVFEIKTLPAGTVLVAESDGTYFDRSNPLFRRLFGYIREKDISMTTPVEGDLDAARMRFYVGRADREKATGSPGVRVVQVPARSVAALGARGTYRAGHVAELEKELRSRLAETAWQADGPAYAVFWNAPFVPWFLKKLEVHVPVVPKPSTP